MATAAQVQWRNQPSRRRGPRYRVQTPVDVTVLRSGIPDTLPGRSVNVGERGAAAVLAGELMPGEAVGVEIWLPVAVYPLRTRALIRHHDNLRCGMEFVGLSVKQQAAIRDWAVEANAEVEPGVRTKLPQAGKDSEGGSSGAEPPARKPRGRRWIFRLAFAVLVILAVGWWQWDRGWKDLESGLQKGGAVKGEQPQAHVSAEEMVKRVTHRVDPDYPAAARTESLQGIVVLDVVVGRDGSVERVYPLNGPKVLGQAAAAALRWWRFEPYLVDGRPVVVETTVAVEFKP